MSVTRSPANPPTRQPMVIFIVGPTGVGKTEVSVKLAKKLNAEIICCDSMQVYKDMDILTAMPEANIFSKVRHHLFAIKKPAEKFSVAEYRKLAVEKIKEIHSRNKNVIFAGGTGLYMRILLDGIFDSPPPDLKLRKKLYAQAKKYGSGYLHNKLCKIDPVSAGNIHVNDTRRIVRALEAYKKTDKPISRLKLDSKGGIFGLYPIDIFCLYYNDRNLLYEKINKRVDEMFDKGVMQEVKMLLKRRLSLTAKQALGIKLLKDYITGKSSLGEAKAQLKKFTRRYAKRQLSWFRQDKRVQWIAIDKFRNVDSIVKLIQGQK